MNGWAIQARIPLEDLGRLRMPPYRIRYKGGFVRTGLSKDKRNLTATLEDKDGRLIPAPSYFEACSRAVMMGRAVAYHLMKHNKYQVGEATGNRELIMVSA